MSDTVYENMLNQTMASLQKQWEECNATYQANPTRERLAAMRSYDAALCAMRMGLAILQDERTDALNWRRKAQADLRGALTRAGILVGGKQDTDPDE